MYVSVHAYTGARRVWGHAPPGKFFEFDVVRWLLRLFGAQNITALIRHGNRILIHFMSARMETSVHQWFQVPGELRECTQVGQNFA